MQLEKLKNYKNNLNPIPELISDTDYERLFAKGFIDERALRDYLLKKEYEECRDNGMRSGKAIKKITNGIKLKPDSVRKILYEKKETTKYKSL